MALCLVNRILRRETEYRTIFLRSLQVKGMGLVRADRQTYRKQTRLYDWR